MMPLGDREVSAAQSVRAEQVRAVDTQQLVRRGGAQPRPAGWIELLDNRLNIESCLLRRNAAAGRRHRDDFQRWIIQCQAQGYGIVNAGVHVEDDFSGH